MVFICRCDLISAESSLDDKRQLLLLLDGAHDQISPGNPAGAPSKQQPELESNHPSVVLQAACHDSAATTCAIAMQHADGAQQLMALQASKDAQAALVLSAWPCASAARTVPLLAEMRNDLPVILRQGARARALEAAGNDGVACNAAAVSAPGTATPCTPRPRPAQEAGSDSCGCGAVKHQHVAVMLHAIDSQDSTAMCAVQQQNAQLVAVSAVVRLAPQLSGDRSAAAADTDRTGVMLWLLPAMLASTRNTSLPSSNVCVPTKRKEPDEAHCSRHVAEVECAEAALQAKQGCSELQLDGVQPSCLLLSHAQPPAADMHAASVSTTDTGEHFTLGAPLCAPELMLRIRANAWHFECLASTKCSNAVCNHWDITLAELACLTHDRFAMPHACASAEIR